MIQLAFSTNAFKKHTLEQAIDAIAAVGYRGVEIMADVPHAYPAGFGGEARARLREQLSRLQLTVCNLNAFTLHAAGNTYHPTWIEEDQSQRELRLAHTLGCLELAHDLACPSISLQPGGPLLGLKLTRREAAERFAEGISAALPTARKLGVVLAIEPEPGLLLQTAAEYLEFKKTFFASEPLVRMNCDVGHLFCVGDDPAQVIRAMPEQIVNVHLEDIGANRVHQHLLPGKGAIDFRSIFAALNDISYRGWVVVELYPYEVDAPEIARRAWDHLVPML